MPEKFVFTPKRKAALKKAQSRAWKSKKSERQMRTFAAARLTYSQAVRAKALIQSEYKKIGFK
jgi:hypothetical protein